LQSKLTKIRASSLYKENLYISTEDLKLNLLASCYSYKLIKKLSIAFATMLQKNVSSEPILWSNSKG
jgi:hypothetical protein